MAGVSEPPHPIDFPWIRRVVWALVALSGVHVAFAMATYDHLPLRIPVHFDGAGAADGWAAKSLGSWFAGWLLPAVIGTLFGWIALRIDRFPVRYLSMPRREEFASLPAERRARVLAVVAFHLLVETGTIMAFFFALHVSCALASLGAISGLPLAVIWGGIGIMLFESFMMIVRIIQAVDREIAAHVRHPGSG